MKIFDNVTKEKRASIFGAILVIVSFLDWFVFDSIEGSIDIFGTTIGFRMLILIVGMIYFLLPNKALGFINGLLDRFSKK